MMELFVRESPGQLLLEILMCIHQSLAKSVRYTRGEMVNSWDSRFIRLYFYSIGDSDRNLLLDFIALYELFHYIIAIELV